MSGLSKIVLYDFLGGYNYHVFLSQHFILEIDLNNQRVELSPMVSQNRPDKINFKDLQLESDFHRITISHDETKKVVELFDSEDIARIRFEYTTRLAFNPIIED